MARPSPEIWKHLIDNYYVSDEGRFKREYKNGKRKYLSLYRKKRVPSILFVKIGNKETNARRAVWEAFNGPIPEDHIVRNKYGYLTASDLFGLECVPKIEANRKAGKVIARKIRDKRTGKIYSGTREAAKALFISRQTVSDYCNGRTKRPLLRLEWYYEE